MTFRRKFAKTPWLAKSSMMMLILVSTSCAGSMDHLDNPSVKEDPISTQFQLSSPYYDGFGFGFGGQANRRLNSDHFLSGGLAVNFKIVNVGRSPGFAQADSTD